MEVCLAAVGITLPESTVSHHKPASFCFLSEEQIGIRSIKLQKAECCLKVNLNVGLGTHSVLELKGCLEHGPKMTQWSEHCARVSGGAWVWG